MEAKSRPLTNWLTERPAKQLNVHLFNVDGLIEFTLFLSTPRVMSQ